jgi:hypothetical protein
MRKYFGKVKANLRRSVLPQLLVGAFVILEE